MSRQAIAAPRAQAPTPVQAGVLQRKCACGQHAVGGECAECRKKRQPLHRRQGNLAEPVSVPQAVHEVLRSPGQPLEPAARAFLEPRFGHDFSGVRVHSDAAAAASARAVNALAYTVGHDVVFGRGLYQPGTMPGRRLLAHELAHVVQQRAATYPAAGLTVADGSWEQEAERAAGAVMMGQAARVTQRVSAPQLARQQIHRDSAALRGEGREVQVDRVVTSGRCRQAPDPRTQVTPEITITRAAIEISYCRGRTRAEAAGSLDYSDVVRRALGAVPSVLSGDPQAFQDLQQSLRQAEPRAEIRLQLQVGDLRGELSGSGRASVEGGAAGELGLGVSGPVGGVELGGRVTVSGGTQEETRVGGTISVSGRPDRDPGCFRCVCSDPVVTFQCTERQDRSEPVPPPQRQIVYVPLFFEYADAIPRQGWEQTYQEMIDLALRHIRDGYTIGRIEGRTSPEGELQRQRVPGFEGNVSLAQRRALAARQDLEAALDREIARESGRSLLLMRGGEPAVLRHLRAARGAGYRVEGHAPEGGPHTAELFGSTGRGEVARRDLPAHLRRELQRPAADRPDPLAVEHVIGEGLPAGVRAEVEADVEAFRAGSPGGRRATERQDLERIYRPFRRALIVLNPPSAEPPRLPTPEELSRIAARVVGTPIPCQPEHRRLFDGRPIPEAWLLEGNCRSAAAGPESGR